MSRSRKHTPYSGDKKDKFLKRYANRKLRRQKLTHDLLHKSYRKNFCSYDICDYYWIATKNFEEYYESIIKQWLKDRDTWHFDDPFPTREECWKDYQKTYIRK